MITWKRRSLEFFALALVFTAVGLPAALRAQDGGRFDGAVWKFKMKLKAGKGDGLKGAFRVSDDVLFQKDKPGDPELKKEVGTNHPADMKHTVMKFTDLRAFAGTNRRLVQGISGAVRLHMDKPGEWSGEMVDGNGRHWKFECVRVAE